MTDPTALGGIVVDLVAAEWNIPSRAAMALLPEIQRELGSHIAVRVIDPRDVCGNQMGRLHAPDHEAQNASHARSPELPLHPADGHTATAGDEGPDQGDVLARSLSAHDSFPCSAGPANGKELRIPIWRVTSAGCLMAELAGARPKREVLDFVRDTIRSRERPPDRRDVSTAPE